MVNSTRCPLCPDGIGHQMDQQHAERVDELLGFAHVVTRAVLRVAKQAKDAEGNQI